MSIKKVLIAAIVALSFNSVAFAGGLFGGPSASAQAGAIALTGPSNSRADVGDVSGGNVDMKFSDTLQVPNAPAMATGSSNTTADGYKYNSTSWSTVLGGRTSTGMELDIIGFLKWWSKIEDENTKAVFDLAACIESPKWVKLREKMGSPCAN